MNDDGSLHLAVAATGSSPEAMALARCGHGLDELAKDQCQTDDFMIAVVTRVLTDAGRAVKTLSKGGRFYVATLSPPRIVCPFYTVVRTHDSRVGILVCPKDAATLYRLVDGTHNPGYEPPTRIEVAPVHLSHWDTKRKLGERHRDWRQSKAARPVSRISGADASRPRLEGLSESPFRDPVADGEHRELQREGYDAVLGGDDPDCGHVTGARWMSVSSVEHARALGDLPGCTPGLMFKLPSTRHAPSPQGPPVRTSASLADEPYSMRRAGVA